MVVVVVKVKVVVSVGWRFLHLSAIPGAADNPASSVRALGREHRGRYLPYVGTVHPRSIGNVHTHTYEASATKVPPTASLPRIPG